MSATLPPATLLLLILEERSSIRAPWSQPCFFSDTIQMA